MCEHRTAKDFSFAHFVSIEVFIMTIATISFFLLNAIFRLSEQLLQWEKKILDYPKRVSSD